MLAIQADQTTLTNLTSSPPWPPRPTWLLWPPLLPNHTNLEQQCAKFATTLSWTTICKIVVRKQFVRFAKKMTQKDNLQKKFHRNVYLQKSCLKRWFAKKIVGNNNKFAKHWPEWQFEKKSVRKDNFKKKVSKTPICKTNVKKTICLEWQFAKMTMKNNNSQNSCQEQ